MKLTPFVLTPAAIGPGPPAAATHYTQFVEEFKTTLEQLLAET